MNSPYGSGTDLKKGEGKLWLPNLSGDFAGRLSFPITQMKAKITNDEFHILFPRVILSGIYNHSYSKVDF